MLVLRSDIKREEFRFKYTMTYFIASQFFNLGLRMDLFLLSYFHFKAEAGPYALAQKIILTIITTVISITQVISPGFSSITAKHQLKKHLKTGFLYLLGPSALFMMFYIVPDSWYCFLFTKNFCEAAPITRALSWPFVIYSLGSLPFLFILYTIKKPIYILYANIMFFLILTLGSYYLIPIKVVYGPPIAIGFAMIVSTAIVSIASIYEYRKMKE